MAEEPARQYGAAAEDTAELLTELEKQMATAAAELEFEKAAHLRDEIARIRQNAATQARP